MKRGFVTAFVVALALPLVAQQQDSILVALAKRTGRLGRIPKHVITNEEVASSNGRISVAWGAEDVKPPTSGNAPAAPSAWSAADAAYAERTAREKATPAPRPTVIEGSTRATYSMPVSTARDATVSSSATSAPGYATAQNATVGSTASTTPRPEMTPTATPPRPVTPAMRD